MSLAAAGLSFEAAVTEGAALRMLIGHAADACRPPADDVAEHLARYILVGVLPGNVATDYPLDGETLDTFARFGLAHGAMDATRGRPPREPPDANPDRQFAYLLGYLAGRMGVTPP